MRIPLLILVLLAGLGVTAHAAPGRPAKGKHATVKTRHGDLGTYLVDGRGRTLYRFMHDSRRKSRCSGACASAWPPLTTRERPEAEGGAKASLLSTIRRGGTRQVVYDGHPLYRYVGDSAPGETNGQGLNAFGGAWYVVAPSGRAVRSGASPPPSPYPY